MKKVLSIVLATTLAASAALTGCSSAPAQSQASSGAASEPASSVASQPATGATGTVTLLSWYNQEKMKDVKSGFEAANPGVELDIQYVPPTNQYVEKFMVLMASNEPTDLFYMCAENKADIITNGFAEDLASLPIVAEINDMTKKIYGSEGKVFGLSLDAWVGGLFYNKTLFENAGVTAVPKTQEELFAAMKKLKDAGVEPLTAQKEDVDRLMFGMFASNEVTKNANIEYEINEGKTTFAAAYKATMDDWYNNVVTPGYLSQTALGLSGEQAEEMFATEKAAMIVGGPWNIANFQAKNPDLKYDMFAIPGKDGKAMLQGAPNVAFSVATKGKNKDGAYKFLDYLSTPEGLKAYQAVTGQIMLVDGVDYQLDPAIDQFKSEAVAGNFYWQPMIWDNSAAILQEFNITTQNILAGVSNVDEALASVDTKMADLKK